MFGHRTSPPWKVPYHSIGDRPRPEPFSPSTAIKEEAARARDELDFKRGLIARLMEAKVPGKERRKIVQRGGKYHRRIKKPGGGYKYIYSAHDEEPTGAEAEKKWLLGRLRRLIDREGKLSPDHPQLKGMVGRHGPRKIAEILHECGDYVIKDGHLVCKGLKVAAPGAGGTGGGSVGVAVGTRKVWGNRVVEKQRDGSWKLVSHVAGLEGERTPKGAVREAHGNKKPAASSSSSKIPKNLTKEQAAKMIQELKEKRRGDS